MSNQKPVQYQRRPNYVFCFKMGQVGNPHAISSKSERVFGERGWEQLKWVWQRIWTKAPEVARYRGDQNSIWVNELINKAQ